MVDSIEEVMFLVSYPINMQSHREGPPKAQDGLMPIAA